MAEESSESARQAPVFYEGASPDGKYVGANEKCHLRHQARKSRAPQESIGYAENFYHTSGALATAVSPVLLFWLAIQFFYSFDDQLVL